MYPIEDHRFACFGRFTFLTKLLRTGHTITDHCHSPQVFKWSPVSDLATHRPQGQFPAQAVSMVVASAVFAVQTGPSVRCVLPP